jgi:hypothetical protein
MFWRKGKVFLKQDVSEAVFRQGKKTWLSKRRDSLKIR